MEPKTSVTDPPPPIPDHELLRCFARGSYGMVWLARSILGSHRAVKVVRRTRFKSERHFEREFEGVRHFEPVSRTHPGFVQILHVGRNDTEGYFYYVMELADPIDPGPRIESRQYAPRTLRAELDRRSKLPLDECIRIALPLLDALETLHRRGLVHRDIKPANFIFVGGAPKFADIGLVAEQSSEGTAVGSAGYNPPEGSGLPAGDLFSFGRVLFEMFSGTPVQTLADHLPDLRPRLTDVRQRAFLELVLHACHLDPQRRLTSASELRRGLLQVLPDSSTVAPAAVGSSEVPAPPPAGPSPTTSASEFTRELGGGAMSPESPFYVLREADHQMDHALARRECVVLLRGARQSGKTSVLARSLHSARRQGLRAVFTDFQKLNRASFETLTAFYHALGESLSDHLDLSTLVQDSWDDRRGPNANFDRYLRRHVLRDGSAHLVWALDEADRLFEQPFHSEFFGLLRAWYNECVLEPGGPWSRLTIAVSYASDVTRFITDLNQSLFNVGFRLVLEDFTPTELAEFNRRHGEPLKLEPELIRFHRWLGGHPYLSRCGLHELSTRGIRLEQLEYEAGRGEGIFREPLRRLLALLEHAPAFGEAMRSLLAGKPLKDAATFDRLRSAGLVSGNSPANARLRCELYGEFFRQNPPAS